MGSESPPPSKIVTEKKGRGGRRAGSGRKSRERKELSEAFNPPPPPKNKGGRPVEFEPTAAQRSLVELLVGVADRPIDVICGAIINPVTQQPIGKGTFYKAFANEIAGAKAKIDGIMKTAMLKRLNAGSDTMMIWMSKNRWGWRDSPAPVEDPFKTGKVPDADGEQITIMGGLPANPIEYAEPPGQSEALAAQAKDSVDEIEAADIDENQQ